MPPSADAADADAGPRRRDPDAHASGSGDGVDPLTGFAAHAKQACAALRDRASLAVDEAAGRLRRALIRAMLLAFAVGLAFLFAGLGVWHVVGGAVGALEPILGSRWAAELLVGTLCLASSAALVLWPLARSRRRRLAALRGRYPDDTSESP